MYVDELKDNFIDLGDYVITNDKLNWVVQPVTIMSEGRLVKEENIGRRKLGKEKYYPTISGIVRFLSKDALFNSIHDYDDCATFVSNLLKYEEKIGEYVKQLEQYDWDNFKVLKEKQKNG